MNNVVNKKTEADFKVTQKLAGLISRNKQSLALQYLDKIIGSNYDLFSKDEDPEAPTKGMTREEESLVSSDVEERRRRV